MSDARPRLAYHKGTLVVHAPRDAGAPHAAFVWDARAELWRASAHRYRELIREAGDRLDDRVLQLPDLPGHLGGSVELREYQETALHAWEAAGHRGVLALPTGAGKTHVALAAFEALATPTLVVAPTLDLVDQWIARLKAAFPRLRIARLAGGKGLKDIEAVTVATYDSAYLHADKIGDRFGLVVFDEAHHLPSEGYRQIAELVPAPYRLGLTATPEREDSLHELYADLTGPVVHRLTVKDLAGSYLAPFDAVRVDTELNDAEREAYRKHRDVWAAYVRGDPARGRRPVSHDRLVMRSGSDPEARRALLARGRARDVMFNAASKVRAMREILERHAGERVIVFTEHNRLVHTLSKRFLLPALTYRTPPGEREEVLARFRDGTYPVLVTSKVLDEGVDVPEASVGVILSGSGSVREFTQRLGRLMRPGDGKRAVLYEVVTTDTVEERTSDRRRRGLKRKAANGGDRHAPA